MFKRVLSLLVALGAVVAALVVLPAATAQAATCFSAWNSSSVYTGGQTASHNGRNYTAKWWTQNERPGSSDVWADNGACGTGGGGEDPGQSNGFVVSEAQFNQMFPNRNSFYTYQGLTDALSAYPAFANTGSDEIKKREAAAFLANVSHETGGLVYIKEVNEANYPHYCDATQPYGCPAGQSAYYGKGPIQLSWNFNYKAAGDALGIDLLNNPYLVEQNAAVAWKTALWYWNTQTGPGTITGHNAIVNGPGFGETIRSINGAIECNGGNPAQVQSRIDKFTQFTQVLGTTTGSNLSC
ncbi:chitinase [Streptomyces griseobrunneus]|uniref:Chitinase n=1 Tax=Streptomyces rhizosphaericola TaxID=2564098 RepID=A0ABY2P7C9_9ACTN|nr:MULTISPECIES: glycoside hydrolase family 19 protein [Streptomyces]ARI53715.1 chitinase [Streptomyces sp. S8]MYT90466.1 chitinase [Streptomyces sp. SID8359]NGO82423.1 chitinase [Streptomyces sp. 196(2019)]TGZ01714.1 chitinase [Streptomyces rhizosphaericola]